MKTISRKVQMEKEREKTDILEWKQRIFTILRKNALGMLEDQKETFVESSKVEWSQLSKVEKIKMARLKRKPCRERTWTEEIEL